MLFSTGRSSNTRPGAMFAVGRESLACPNDDGERKPLHSCREISFAPASNQAVRPAEHSDRSGRAKFSQLGGSLSRAPTTTGNASPCIPVAKSPSHQQAIRQFALLNIPAGGFCRLLLFITGHSEVIPHKSPHKRSGGLHSLC